MPSSRNTNLVRLRGFAEFAEVSLARVARAKEVKSEPEALDSRELARLITAATKIDSHTAACVTFLAETGLRYHEFAALQRSDLRERNRVKYLLVFGKGRKERVVPLTSRALDAWNELSFAFNHYFEKRFRGHLARAGKSARLPYHAHPHLLRATFMSIHLNEKRTDSALVAKLAGHASVDTMVKHYFKASLDILAEVMAA